MKRPERDQDQHFFRPESGCHDQGQRRSAVCQFYLFPEVRASKSHNYGSNLCLRDAIFRYDANIFKARGYIKKRNVPNLRMFFVYILAFDA